jgi:hypothetical protein
MDNDWFEDETLSLIPFVGFFECPMPFRLFFGELAQRVNSALWDFCNSE